MREEKRMLSRRQWVVRLSTMAGLVGLSRQKALAEETPTKITQEAAQYQDHPKNGRMCGMCRFYIPPGGRAGSGMMGGQMGPGMMGRQMGPGMMGRQMGPGMMAAGTCQLVEGSISPMGWCILYRALGAE